MENLLYKPRTFFFFIMLVLMAGNLCQANVPKDNMNRQSGMNISEHKHKSEVGAIDKAKKARQEYKTEREICYSSSLDEYAVERCRLDVYYKEGAKNLPVLVWFHGGGLTSGSKFIPEELKNSGIIVVAVNYRLMPNVPISACISDAAESIAWTFKNIENFGGDISKIFVTGHSAGGYLTNMVGLDKKWLASFGIDADSIAGLAPLSGQAITHFAQRNLQGISALQPTVDEWAPLTYVRGDASPILIISGDRELEMNGRYEEQAYFWRMLKLCGHKDVQIWELQGYNHGNMASPALPLVKTFIRRICEEMNTEK